MKWSVLLIEHFIKKYYPSKTMNDELKQVFCFLLNQNQALSQKLKLCYIQYPVEQKRQMYKDVRCRSILFYA